PGVADAMARTAELVAKRRRETSGRTFQRGGSMAAEPKFEADSNSFPLEELEPAPEIFVDGYQGAMAVNGVVKFNFFSIYHDALSGGSKRRIVLRLAMPIASVDGVQKAFADLIEGLKKAGAIMEAPPDGKS